MHGVFTEGRILSIGDRGGGNGLRPPDVREADAAARGRPLSGGGLGSHGLYAQCRTDESRPDTCPRRGPATGATTRPPTPFSGRPRRKSWRNPSGGNSDTAEATTAGTEPVGVVAPGVPAKMVGVATTTTAAGATATMVKAGEGRRVLVAALDASKGETRPEPTGAAAAARDRSTGERRNSARGTSAWNGSSTSSRSSSGSTTDHGKATVEAGKRQVTPSLVDIASAAERLSKLTVPGDRTKPVSSDLARARTAELTTAAKRAKSTLGNSVRSAYVKLTYKDVFRISVLPFPASFDQV